ncbi:hypothetical protein EDB19DRAFT_397908 [Suillus lakei]|nr:hypothetical protein EDB19DRAFT_397908 [Suillus lakei]
MCASMVTLLYSALHSVYAISVFNRPVQTSVSHRFRCTSHFRVPSARQVQIPIVYLGYLTSYDAATCSHLSISGRIQWHFESRRCSPSQYGIAALLRELKIRVSNVISTILLNLVQCRLHIWYVEKIVSFRCGASTSVSTESPTGMIAYERTLSDGMMYSNQRPHCLLCDRTNCFTSTSHV